MTLKTIALALLLCVLSFPVLAAAENPNLSAKSLSLCQTTEDCVVAETVCPHVWSAINKKYQAEHTARIEKMRPTVDCMTPDIEVAKPDAALCVENKCELVQSVNMSKLPGLYECTADEDCVIAEGICPGWWISVNKLRVTDQEAQVKRNRPIVKCKTPISPDKPDLSVCVENKCGVKQVDITP